MRAYDWVPEVVAREIVRLNRKNRDWVRLVPTADGGWNIHGFEDTWLRQLIAEADYNKTQDTSRGHLMMVAFSWWLRDGPVMFRPTAEQAIALEAIDVCMKVEEYTQPYPTVLVDLSHLPGIVRGVMVASQGGWLITVVHFNDRGYCLTTLCHHQEPIEDWLRVYDRHCDDVTPEDRERILAALHIALNSCLALSSFGHHAEYLYPKEVERDRHLGREQSERGQRARDRLRVAMREATLSRDVVLHRTIRRPAGEGEPVPTGRSMPFHRRRGHWAMTPCGPRNPDGTWQEAGEGTRRRVLRPPVFIRRDLLVGEVDEHETIYHTDRTKRGGVS